MVINEAKKKETDDLAATAAKGALWKDVLSRFLRSRAGVFGLIVVVILIFMVVFAPLLTHYQYDVQSFPERFQLPSKTHIFGTDEFGRDEFSRILYGGRVSLLVAFLATVISSVVGVVLGATAGYFGGKVDILLSRVFDIILAVPGMLLAIAISATFGGGILTTAFAISIGSIGNLARLIRSTVMSVKANEFVEAATANGSSNARIIFVHVLPNCIAPLFVSIANNIGTNIMVIAGLSFIGLGVKPPIPEWGAMLNAGRSYIRDFVPTILFPALFIMFTILAFNLLGDALRDSLDPRMKD